MVTHKRNASEYSSSVVAAPRLAGTMYANNPFYNRTEVLCGRNKRSIALTFYRYIPMLPKFLRPPASYKTENLQIHPITRAHLLLRQRLSQKQSQEYQMLLKRTISVSHFLWITPYVSNDCFPHRERHLTCLSALTILSLLLRHIFHPSHCAAYILQPIIFSLDV